MDFTRSSTAGHSTKLSSSTSPSEVPGGTAGHALARQLKEGLAPIPKVSLHTTLDPRPSFGIMCFEIEGVEPSPIVKRLMQRLILATRASASRAWRHGHARLTPGLLNSEEEIEETLRAIRELAVRA